MTKIHTLRGLYIVTPDWDDTAQLLAVTEQVLLGGAALVQYRHKTADMELRRQQASALLALCRRFGKPFIVNDHLDLCMEIDADGLHVGGTDISVAEARAQIGADKILGASCYGDIQLARSAVASGASYIAFGGFYPSRIKQYAVTTPADIVSDAGKEFDLPRVVIGGMTLQNCQPLIANGAEMVAVISSVYMAENPRQAAADFCGLF
ncbi:thiamine phosphate synthase [Undibacterium sp. 14-3-2]|jgi:thiamine-phosphate pyrophosphorylase|uniref:thiamine phosphate synthase n=1 Tax=Undibacterium sp. 14-3-2 TaxID=2800129 RepID=UPI0019088D3D|nr:thiamine phosphate synthase [Undibacterium sp. 14-3-2]MBK1889917.1 thiamine phosphate synthase [Undibacterium sp. 14-3-2]